MTTTAKRRVTLFLIPELLTHARAQAIVEGRTLTELVEVALMEYLPMKTVIEKIGIIT